MQYSPPAEKWIARFERKHGEGKYEWLVNALRNTDMKYESIAEALGVQGHQYITLLARRILRPDEPAGRARRRINTLEANRRKVYEDPLFKELIHLAETEGLQEETIQLIRSGKSGFRKNAAMVKGRKTLLRRTTREGYADGLNGRKTYAMVRPKEECDYVFYSLEPGRSLWLPADSITYGRTSFRDSERSKYRAYINKMPADLNGNNADSNGH